ncbi:MAG TPA: DUF3616 domain-containing protein [Fibrobacteraceae bacterium]|nr:DUF3616 domain-containing protein [Fibrobacteraceae bacterium]
MRISFLVIGVIWAFAGGAELPPPVRHQGMCDASAGVPAGADLFWVANDEDNILRLYSASSPGEPVQTYNLTPFLQTTNKHSEVDLEGATQIGNRTYWIASHGNNKNGKYRPNRHVLFALEMASTASKLPGLRPVGLPYRNLLESLTNASSFQRIGFREASQRAPEAFGGLNIEGLSATPEGHLLIGFRNPLPQNNALVVDLQNPEAVLLQSKKPRFGQPILLNLGGRGIRSMEYIQKIKAYLIIAGPVADKGTFRLFRWSGKTDQAPVDLGSLEGLGTHPEGLLQIPGDPSHLLILGDGGSDRIQGVACKEAPPAQQRFFGFQIPIPK